MSVITQDGDSALMIAAYYGRTEVVVELVKAGADLNFQNKVCHKVEDRQMFILRSASDQSTGSDFSQMTIVLCTANQTLSHFCTFVLWGKYLFS